MEKNNEFYKHIFCDFKKEVLVVSLKDTTLFIGKYETRYLKMQIEDNNYDYVDTKKVDEIDLLERI